MTDDAPRIPDGDAAPLDGARRSPEQPLHMRKRLSVPPQPAGDPPTRFANMALGLDAAFCNIVGLVFTLIGAFLSERLGAPGWALTVFGVGVLLWSFMVTLYANRRVSRPNEVARIMRINLVVVVLGVIVLAIPDTMTSDGKIVLAIWTLFTLGFAIAQFLALRGLPTTTA